VDPVAAHGVAMAIVVAAIADTASRTRTIGTRFGFIHPVSGGWKSAFTR
jgi:hypothetical protein